MNPCTRRQAVAGKEPIRQANAHCSCFDQMLRETHRWGHLENPHWTRGRAWGGLSIVCTLCSTRSKPFPDLRSHDCRSAVFLQILSRLMLSSERTRYLQHRTICSGGAGGSWSCRVLNRGRRVLDCLLSRWKGVVNRGKGREGESQNFSARLRRERDVQRVSAAPKL